MSMPDQAVATSEATAGAGGRRGAERVVLTSFADVDEAFRSRAFVQAGGGHGGSASVYGHTLLSLSGEDHFERRRLESVLFRNRALATYEADVLVPALRLGLARLAATRGSDGVVRGDLLPLVRSALLRVSARLVGLDGMEDEARLDRLYRLVLKLTAGANVEYAVGDHEAIVREAAEAKAAFVAEFLGPARARREEQRARPTRGAAPGDLLSLLIQHEDYFREWGEETSTNEACLFLVASSGSPTNAAMHVVRELLQWLDAHQEDRSHLGEPDFLRGAVTETLRLHPGVPYQLRRTAEDNVLPGGRAVPAGTLVALDVRSASRDTSVFGKDAHRFDPYRAVQYPAAPFGFTFGGGPHMCMGRGLTLGEPGRGAEAIGLLVLLARELFAAGVELDPERPPRRRADSRRDEYEVFPVRFGNL